MNETDLKPGTDYSADSNHEGILFMTALRNDARKPVGSAPESQVIHPCAATIVRDSVPMAKAGTHPCKENI
jgi:hypothetical protein